MSRGVNYLRFCQAGWKFHARLFCLWASWNPRKMRSPTPDEWTGLQLMMRDGDPLLARLRTNFDAKN